MIKTIIVALVFGLFLCVLTVNAEPATSVQLPNDESNAEPMTPLEKALNGAQKNEEIKDFENRKKNTYCDGYYESLKDFSALERKHSEKYKEKKKEADQLCKNKMEELKTKYFYVTSPCSFPSINDYSVKKQGFEIPFAEAIVSSSSTCKDLNPPMFDNQVYLTNLKSLVRYVTWERCECSRALMPCGCDCYLTLLLKIPEKKAIGVEKLVKAIGNRKSGCRSQAYIVFKYIDPLKHIGKASKVILGDGETGDVFYETSLK